MGRNRIPAKTVIQKNLYRILGPELDSNLEKIEKNTGISSFTIRSWLNGRRYPSIKKLREVAECIGFQFNEVFREDERLPEEPQPITVSSVHRRKVKIAPSGG